MGVLHCMVRLLTRLDPRNIAIRERLLARYRADRAALKEETSLAELEARLKEGQHFPDYERKLYLIENCIYGVDIQPIATQISKLRFFISLLCDQLRTSYDPSAENFGLLSLPNLEAKFVCANTLVSLPEVGALDASVGDIAALRWKLQENRHKIFSARSTATKEKYKARDLEIRDAIRKEVRDSLSKPDEEEIARWNALIADSRKRREAVAEPDWEEVEQPAEMDLFGNVISPARRVKRDRNAPKRAEIDAVISWAKENIAKEKAKGDLANVGAATRYADMVAGWDPYDQNKSESWFDPEWMFNLSGGFDIVIGNPPYGKIFSEANNRIIGNRYKFFSDTKDAFVAFIGFAIDAMRVGGVMYFILPSSWHGGPAYRSLREYCLKNTILNLIELPFDMFDNAYIDTGIVGISKKPPADGWQVVAHRFHSKDTFSVDCTSCFERIEQQKWELIHDKKLILANSLIDLECHLATIKTTLGDFIVAKRGVLLEQNATSLQRTAKKNWRYFQGDVYRYELNKAFSWIAFGEGFKEGPKTESWYKGKRILLRRLMNRSHRLLCWP